MNHQSFHQGAKFEGYYTRFFVRETGSSLIFIVCTVPNAPDATRRHCVALTYVPGPADTKANRQRGVWQTELFPGSLELVCTTTVREEKGFTLSTSPADAPLSAFQRTEPFLHGPSPTSDLRASCLSTFKCHLSGSTPIHFDAKCLTRTPWEIGRYGSTPASWLAYLPLPLHWHVHSVASETTLQLSISPSRVGSAEQYNESRSIEDKQAIVVRLPANGGVNAIAHEEKNWANGFPTAHMWLQAHSPPCPRESLVPDQEEISQGYESGVCLAGGPILGQTAYLLVYQNSNLGLTLTFRPPLTLAPFHAGWVNPFFRVCRDWARRRFTLSVSNVLRHKLEIEAQAPKGTFFTFSAPKPTGFQKGGSMAQSLEARVKVTVYRRAWDMRFWRPSWRASELGKWKLVAEDVFNQAGLEFGGEYFPLRGTGKVEEYNAHEDNSCGVAVALNWAGNGLN